MRPDGGAPLRASARRLSRLRGIGFARVHGYSIKSAPRLVALGRMRRGEGGDGCDFLGRLHTGQDFRCAAMSVVLPPVSIARICG
jgi:hypothetical protein